VSWSRRKLETVTNGQTLPYYLSTPSMFCGSLYNTDWRYDCQLTLLLLPNQILEFIFIYIVYLNINKNWKIYWSEQYSTGLGPEHRCLWWGLSTGLLYSDWQFLKRRLAIFFFLQISKEKKLIIIFSTQTNVL
jgi:hypothetical protein